MAASQPAADDLVQIEQILEHFEQLEAQFQAVREGLARSHRLATLGTIVAVIAHEYNNILTPVISYAQLALGDPGDAELTRKALEKSLAGAERAGRISASLLGFAREADDQHVAPLRKVAHEALDCMARHPAKDGIEVTIDLPEVKVAIPPLSLQQVLLNLFLNAGKVLAGGGGRLSITGTVEAGLVRILVADNGPGIPAQIRDRLFEPFVTCPVGNPSKGGGTSSGGGGKGTGLGLCICRDLVRAAGGTITVESRPGQGTTFAIVLPLADDLLGGGDD